MNMKVNMRIYIECIWIWLWKWIRRFIEEINLNRNEVQNIKLNLIMEMNINICENVY